MKRQADTGTGPVTHKQLTPFPHFVWQVSSTFRLTWQNAGHEHSFFISSSTENSLFHSNQHSLRMWDFYFFFKEKWDCPQWETWSWDSRKSLFLRIQKNFFSPGLTFSYVNPIVYFRVNETSPVTPHLNSGDISKDKWVIQ